MSRKHMGLRVLANTVFAALIGFIIQFEANEASFLIVSMSSLCLQVAQIPRSRDMAIFMLTTDDRQP